jgi:hypothetical protein
VIRRGIGVGAARSEGRRDLDEERDGREGEDQPEVVLSENAVTPGDAVAGEGDEDRHHDQQPERRTEQRREAVGDGVTRSYPLAVRHR